MARPRRRSPMCLEPERCFMNTTSPGRRPGGRTPRSSAPWPIAPATSATPAAGGDVILTPETPWSRRRMFILYGSTTSAAVPLDVVRARTTATSSGDYASYVRTTTCSGGERFSFAGLPDGGWFVITLAKPVDGQGEPIAVMRRVETRGGPRNGDARTSGGAASGARKPVNFIHPRFRQSRARFWSIPRERQPFCALGRLSSQGKFENEVGGTDEQDSENWRGGSGGRRLDGRHGGAASRRSTSRRRRRCSRWRSRDGVHQKRRRRPQRR